MTLGQPGLVCALCRDLVELSAEDRAKPVTMDVFLPLLRHYLREKSDRNISDILNRAEQERELMMRVLFNGDVRYRTDHAAMAFLHAHGVITNVEGTVRVPVPIYRERLIAALSPLARTILEPASG